MSIQRPKVSLVLINFNYASYVGAAIESVEIQDYQNFECLVVDNNSTDGSREIINGYKGKDSRFRFLYLDRNLNQIGALLHVLDELTGDYITIVDSDDVLFSNYISTHVATHLAAPSAVAFTSSCVLEVDYAGTILTSGYDAFLLATSVGVPLRKINSKSSDEKSSVTADCDVTNYAAYIAPEKQGWHWSPGTANMHRLSLIRATRPQSKRAEYVGATDNYFMWLNHAISGSVTIHKPLSAYRNHDANRFASMVSMPGLQNATMAGVNRSEIRRRDITRELVSRPEHFNSLAPGQFWRLMDAPATAVVKNRTSYYKNPNVIKLIEQNLLALISAFGENEVRENLSERMGRKVYSDLRFRAQNNIIAKMPPS